MSRFSPQFLALKCSLLHSGEIHSTLTGLTLTKPRTGPSKPEPSFCFSSPGISPASHFQRLACSHGLKSSDCRGSSKLNLSGILDLTEAAGWLRASSRSLLKLHTPDKQPAGGSPGGRTTNERRVWAEEQKPGRLWQQQQQQPELLNYHYQHLKVQSGPVCLEEQLP